METIKQNPTSLCASSCDAYAYAGFADYSDYSDRVEYCDQREYGDGQLEGNWYYIPDPESPHNPTGLRAIYSGTFGNYNSPGADSCTHAESFDLADQADADRYANLCRVWTDSDEFAESQEEEESETADD